MWRLYFSSLPWFKALIEVVSRAVVPTPLALPWLCFWFWALFCFLIIPDWHHRAYGRFWWEVLALTQIIWEIFIRNFDTHQLNYRNIFNRYIKSVQLFPFQTRNFSVDYRVDANEQPTWVYLLIASRLLKATKIKGCWLTWFQNCNLYTNLTKSSLQCSWSKTDVSRDQRFTSLILWIATTQRNSTQQGY